mmetsp:Transcript_57518/g.64341  ORF Transcript_57518/g.64341 Transcript_57518/m.64341 type:complete len:237 (+) Transcript_57518:199-909(+)
MRQKKGSGMHNPRKNAVRERMKKKLMQEQEAARQKQKEQIELAKKLGFLDTEQRKQMDETERDNQLIEMLKNRHKFPQETQLKIDKFEKDFLTNLSEHGIEFNDDGKLNHELSTYDETDDFKDRKVAAKATAERKAAVAALPKTAAMARIEERTAIATASVAAAKAATAAAEAAKRQQVEAAVAAALAKETATTTTTTEVVTEVPAPAVPKTQEEIAALQKATNYIHDYLVKGHYY